MLCISKSSSQLNVNIKHKAMKLTVNYHISLAKIWFSNAALSCATAFPFGNAVFFFF